MNSRVSVIFLAIGALVVLAVFTQKDVRNDAKNVVAKDVSAGIVTIPDRPEKIVFEPLSYEPPSAAAFRRQLRDGTVVFLAPSHEFPLVNVVMTFKGGSSRDPVEIPGLASMTARLLREGGVENISPAELDETLDFLATEISVSASDTFTTARMNCLKQNLDESLSLFMAILRNPAFDEGRLKTTKARLLESLKQRNDNASSILGREWRQLLYGTEHFEGSQPTGESVAAISRSRLAEMHQQLFHPGNVIIAVSGDFEEQDILSRLERLLGDWEHGKDVPDPIAPSVTLEPGLYHVHKDIPQGKVILGLRSITRNNSDLIPLLLLDEILGAGGFTSRLMQQVRSNEGLAYSVRSTVTPKVYYPGDFRVSFESKNATVALATKIVLNEINKIRDEPVTEEELETAKQSLIETFPRQFESKSRMLRVFVNDEWTGRPKDFWKTFREKVKSVSREDIQRVAQQYLDPDQMAILVVGNWEKIAPGDLEKRAQMDEFFDGRVTHLPSRDPITLEPVVEEEKGATSANDRQ